MGLKIGSSFTTEDGGKVTIIDITIVFAASIPSTMIKYEWTFKNKTGIDWSEVNTFCEIYNIRSAS